MCLAPSFLRFGSLEVFVKPQHAKSSAAPSLLLESGNHGDAEALSHILDTVIQLYFKDLWKKHDNLVQAAIEGAGHQAKHAMYLELLHEVVCRTAALAAAWQAAGFVHGSLGTENMSLVGVTLEPGACGRFLGLYDPDCSGAFPDPSGRFSFRNQASACKHNCDKLAEALAAAGMFTLGDGKSEAGRFWDEFAPRYSAMMRGKLGLLWKDEGEVDVALIQALVDAMESTGADYNTVFQVLEELPLEGRMAEGSTSSNGFDHTKGDDTSCPFDTVLERLLQGLPSPAELAEATKPALSCQALEMLLSASASNRDPALLNNYGTWADHLKGQMRRVRKTAPDSLQTREEKSQADRAQWSAWMWQFRGRLRREAEGGGDQRIRREFMRGINPRPGALPLQADISAALEACERDSFVEVQQLLLRIAKPFEDAVGNGTAAESSHKPASRDRLEESAAAASSTPTQLE